MSMRSIVDREFPRGWWRSWHWWLTGAKEMAFSCVAAVAAVLLVGDARRALRHRSSPRELSRLRVPSEGWAAGLMIGSLVSGSLALTTTYENSPLGLLVTVLLLLWFLANIAVCVTVLVVLVRSRWRQRSEWHELDFIERHVPRYGVPPGTPEEYRALRLKQQD